MFLNEPLVAWATLGARGEGIGRRRLMVEEGVEKEEEEEEEEEEGEEEGEEEEITIGNNERSLLRCNPTPTKW